MMRKAERRREKGTFCACGVLSTPHEHKREKKYFCGTRPRGRGEERAGENLDSINSKTSKHCFVPFGAPFFLMRKKTKL